MSYGTCAHQSNDVNVLTGDAEPDCKSGDACPWALRFWRQRATIFQRQLIATISAPGVPPP